MRLLTTAVVAERLGVHQTRVQVLIREGRLPAQKFGKMFLVDEKHLKLVADRKPGRPRSKAKAKRRGGSHK
ncbi:MAG TPA: helix-turn-helix domain-containing protein [Blastocatellia bacterium]|nr:helix-turn-helix domain-containing protein [Blastocatellia bacterium]